MSHQQTVMEATMVKQIFRLVYLAFARPVSVSLAPLLSDLVGSGKDAMTVTPAPCFNDAPGVAPRATVHR